MKRDNFKNISCFYFNVKLYDYLNLFWKKDCLSYGRIRADTKRNDNLKK